jgi:hypothetical protein
MEIWTADNQGSGALNYLRSELFHRAAIHTYMPVHWLPPSTQPNSLNVGPLVVITSKTRYLTLPEQALMHAALRRSAKVRKALPPT